MAWPWLLWLLLVVAYDLHQRRVPNWLVLAGAIGAVLALSSHIHPFGISWRDAVLGAGAGFGFMLIFYSRGVMGAADVKFAGALGLWVGLQPLLPIWIGASLLAGVHSTLWLLVHRSQRFTRLTEALSGVSTHDQDDPTAHRRRRHIPFAAYLAIASLGWLLWGNSIR